MDTLEDTDLELPQASSPTALQRQNKPQKLPRAEKQLLPTIIVTPSSPSLQPYSPGPDGLPSPYFHHLVYAPPPPPRAPHPLFKPFAALSRRARYLIFLLAFIGLLLLWHALFARGGYFNGTQAWSVYFWAEVERAAAWLGELLGLLRGVLVDA